MKKLLFILFLIVVFSCEKPPAIYCWQCETVSTNEVIVRVTNCSMTESEIQDFAVGMDAAASALTGTRTYTMCYKKLR